jgi:hypothetical protein
MVVLKRLNLHMVARMAQWFVLASRVRIPLSDMGVGRSYLTA